MMNQLLYEVNVALKLLKGEPSTTNKARYSRKLKALNSFGQDPLHLVYFTDGSQMFVNVTDIQDVRDILASQYPHNIADRIVPIECKVIKK